MAVPLARHLHYDFERPDDPANDHLVFSKGPRLAASTAGSRVTPPLSSLGLSGKRLEHRDYRVRALCGDSEMSEGSVWEASLTRADDFVHGRHQPDPHLPGQDGTPAYPSAPTAPPG